MRELTKPEYLQTMALKMKRFHLTSIDHKKTILEIAYDMLISKNIVPAHFELEYCYENNKGNYSHYLVNWGEKDKYIVIIADDESNQWYGFKILDIKKEYGLK